MTRDVLASLERSRHNILHKVLPVFTSTKNPIPPPAQHTLTSLSTAVTLSIGPHTFTCELFLVIWAPETRTLLPPPVQDDITPLLIQQLNDTAAQDPVLAGVLSRAKTGQATTDELQGLASYVDAMRQHHIKANPPLPSVGEPIQYEFQAPQSIIIEFQDSLGERFIIPAHFRFEEGPAKEIIISFFIPIETRTASGPAPCTIVFYDVVDETRAEIHKASRTSREIEPQLEDWWKSSVSSFLSLFLSRKTDRVMADHKCTIKSLYY